MPFTIHIYPDINCAYFNFTGVYDMSARETSVEELLNHPDYQKGMNILRDVREQRPPPEINYKSITDELKTKMREYDLMLDKCRWAVVVGDARSYAKVHQDIVTGRLGNNPVERKAFRNIDEAKTWLSIPTTYIFNEE